MPGPLTVCPAQSRVIPFLPMMSPPPEQGPMFPVRVVLAVIVAPHTGLAKTEGRAKRSVEPRTVRRSRILRLDIG